MHVDNSLLRFSGMLQSVQGTKSGPAETNKAEQPGNESVFEKLLQKNMQTGRLSFSKHAEQRLIQREINLSQEDMNRLYSAVAKAEEKGVRNTLVLMDQTAFIVNVPGSVVITAMNGEDLKDNIFTQIDGAVVL